MALNKVLIIKHGSLGDIFMSLDSINSVCSHFGENVYFCTTASGKKVLMDLGFNFKYIVDFRSKNPLVFIYTIYKIIKEDFDYIVDLQNSSRTCFYITVLNFFRKSIISSTCSSASHKYTPPPHGTHHVSQGLKEQLKIINIKIIKFSDNIKINENNNKNCSVLIVPGSSIRGKYKRWPIECFNELIKDFLKINFNCYIIGGDEDLDISSKILKHPQVHNLIGSSPWKKVIELALNADIAISNDTSNMHLISSLGCPTIAIMKKGPLVVSNAPSNNQSFCFTNSDISKIKPNEVFKKVLKIVG
jgi:ADP-heptose:LPS heptosyltransferase|tara:strand:- start:2271 stop:3179 length:909 start_codon:yes stop_codon:yes gene_type:complete